MNFPPSRMYGPPWLPKTLSTALPPAPYFRKSVLLLCPSPGPEELALGGTYRENGCPSHLWRWKGCGGRVASDAGSRAGVEWREAVLMGEVTGLMGELAVRQWC